MTSVAIRLGHAMAARGVEQQELARAAGCSQVTISKILSGLIEHSRFLPEIAAVLGVDLSGCMEMEGIGLIWRPEE